MSIQKAMWTRQTRTCLGRMGLGLTGTSSETTSAGTREEMVSRTIDSGAEVSRAATPLSLQTARIQLGVDQRNQAKVKVVKLLGRRLQLMCAITARNQATWQMSVRKRKQMKQGNLVLLPRQAPMKCRHLAKENSKVQQQPNSLMEVRLT